MVLAQQEENSLTSALTQLNRFNDGQKDLVRSSMGIPDASDFSLIKLVGYFVFGGIGFVAFVYGKKERNFKPLSIGIALMGYSYFFTSTLWLYIGGIGLCLLLYYWRD